MQQRLFPQRPLALPLHIHMKGSSATNLGLVTGQFPALTNIPQTSTPRITSHGRLLSCRESV
jgi:hypothetical protein